MAYQETNWHGYTCMEFEFQGRKAKLVCPKEACEGNKWLLKTEYFGAFPEFELEMLERGYHVAYVANKTRWHDATDDDMKKDFCDFLCREHGLNEKCLLVGMSCGGMHAVYFTAKYPEKVAALYLDAPVLNLLSCPTGVGLAGDELYAEFVEHTGITKSELINYRNHPIDNVEPIAMHKIPVFLVAGDNDTVVPYAENGKILFYYLKGRGVHVQEIIKEDCGHHPHGLSDNTPLVQFALENY